MPIRTLMCPWGQRQAFLRDESRWDALQQAAARDYAPVVEDAISTVFEATSDETGFDRVWTVDPERAHRLWRHMRPAHALIREWTKAGELGLLREENQRLRQLLGRALHALRRAGDEQSANRLERALRGQ